MNAECGYGHKPQVSHQVATKLIISMGLTCFSPFKGKIKSSWKHNSSGGKFFKLCFPR